VAQFLNRLQQLGLDIRTFGKQSLYRYLINNTPTAYHYLATDAPISPISKTSAAAQLSTALNATTD